jgi:AmmeMemoRadiSam system protein A
MRRVSIKKHWSLLSATPRKNSFRRALPKNVNSAAREQVVTLMLAMRLRGGCISTLLRYATSADTARTSPANVVGYSSIVFTAKKGEPSMNTMSEQAFSESEKKELLEIAKRAITEYVLKKKRLPVHSDNPFFLEKRGAFVTLKKKNELRGCIGRIIAEQPLIEVIRDMAIEAAFADPRFDPLSKDEVNDIELEISVLSPLRKISNADEIEVGTHGLLIKKGFYSGLLLPQVATQYHWTRDEFLQHTCRKAGLGPDDWKKGAQLYVFSAQIFSEKELR